MELNLKVEGMTCEGCENRIKNSLKLIDGVEDVTASHQTGEVKVKISKDNKDEIIKAIEDLDFKVEKKKKK